MKKFKYIKKSILGAVVVTIAVVAAFNLNINTLEEGLSAISLDNVEALASEGGTKHYWCCGNTGTCVQGPNYVIHGSLRTFPCN